MFMVVLDVIKPDRTVIGPFDNEQDARYFAREFLAPETEYEVRGMESMVRYL